MIKKPLKAAALLDQLVGKIKADSHLDELDGMSRPQIAGAICAHHLAYNLPIPSGPLNEMRPEEHFLTQYQDGVVDALASINEHCPLAITSATKVTKELWLLRYAMVHAPKSRPAMNSLLHVLASKNVEGSWVGRADAMALHHGLGYPERMDLFVGFGQYLED